HTHHTGSQHTHTHTHTLTHTLPELRSLGHGSLLQHKQSPAPAETALRMCSAWRRATPHVMHMNTTVYMLMHTHAHTHTYTHTDTQTHRHTDTQTHRHTHHTHST